MSSNSLASLLQRRLQAGTNYSLEPIAPVGSYEFAKAPEVTFPRLNTGAGAPDYSMRRPDIFKAQVANAAAGIVVKQLQSYEETKIKLAKKQNAQSQQSQQGQTPAQSGQQGPRRTRVSRGQGSGQQPAPNSSQTPATQTTAGQGTPPVSPNPNTYVPPGTLPGGATAPQGSTPQPAPTTTTTVGSRRSRKNNPPQGQPAPTTPAGSAAPAPTAPQGPVQFPVPAGAPTPTTQGTRPRAETSRRAPWAEDQTPLPLSDDSTKSPPMQRPAGTPVPPWAEEPSGTRSAPLPEGMTGLEAERVVDRIRKSGIESEGEIPSWVGERFRRPSPQLKSQMSTGISPGNPLVMGQPLNWQGQPARRPRRVDLFMEAGASVPTATPDLSGFDPQEVQDAALKGVPVGMEGRTKRIALAPSLSEAMRSAPIVQKMNENRGPVSAFPRALDKSGSPILADDEVSVQQLRDARRVGVSLSQPPAEKPAPAKKARKKK